MNQNGDNMIKADVNEDQKLQSYNDPETLKTAQIPGGQEVTTFTLLKFITVDFMMLAANSILGIYVASQYYSPCTKTILRATSSGILIFAQIMVTIAVVSNAIYTMYFYKLVLMLYIKIYTSLVMESKHEIKENPHLITLKGVVRQIDSLRNDVRFNRHQIINFWQAMFGDAIQYILALAMPLIVLGGMPTTQLAKAVLSTFGLSKALSYPFAKLMAMFFCCFQFDSRHYQVTLQGSVFVWRYAGWVGLMLAPIILSLNPEKATSATALRRTLYFTSPNNFCKVNGTLVNAPSAGIFAQDVVVLTNSDIALTSSNLLITQAGSINCGSNYTWTYSQLDDKGAFAADICPLKQTEYDDCSTKCQNDTNPSCFQDCYPAYWCFYPRDPTPCESANGVCWDSFQVNQTSWTNYFVNSKGVQQEVEVDGQVNLNFTVKYENECKWP